MKEKIEKAFLFVTVIMFTISINLISWHLATDQPQTEPQITLDIPMSVPIGKPINMFSQRHHFISGSQRVQTATVFLNNQAVGSVEVTSEYRATWRENLHRLYLEASDWYQLKVNHTIVMR